MGIIVHPDEIIDELKREFLPPEFTDRVFASNPTSQLKMLVYDARSGIERLSPGETHRVIGTRPHFSMDCLA
jgi:hypothetical protein